ncbi:MAG: SDR family NAD(P)-dependent oxidoreductase [Candidatus Kerfeldbacteria bacterium]|nr:SDR family NAD(P)-dependent oxidoreductase [Candidatus Kerfeldbacteria bacterium]
MKILVTGASGSFGTALIKAVLADGTAEKVIAFARGEHRLAELRETLGHPPQLRCLIGDVRDPDRLHDALHRVDTIVHAAALKKVDGQDPRELMLTNYQGTVNVVRAAISRTVPRVLLLSSDKSVGAATAYGVAKAAAEAYMTYANRFGHPQVRLSATRYGNVIGSQGSVIHTWRRQSARGEPLTITDPNATRFWLTMDDAVAFVRRALTVMHGGEILIPEMRSASLGDLCTAMFPGHLTKAMELRAGEKLHEVLISSHEAYRTVYVPEFPGWAVEPSQADWPYQPWRGRRLEVGCAVSSASVPRIDPSVLRRWASSIA